VAFIAREGADALMPTALTGEGPLLTADETIAVWEATIAAPATAGASTPSIACAEIG
jgi:dihydrodipicolinate synthase/N-acetylneuraminate lyase